MCLQKCVKHCSVRSKSEYDKTSNDKNDKNQDKGNGKLPYKPKPLPEKPKCMLSCDNTCMDGTEPQKCTKECKPKCTRDPVDLKGMDSNSFNEFGVPHMEKGRC